MSTGFRNAAPLLALWAISLSVALYFRPLMPVDETRYLSVAWEMWQRRDFLVPWLNGEVYSHKPPLLFWLMHAGWFVFGVNEWWPRLVAPVFSLGNLYLTWSIARRLWPSDEWLADYAPWVLFGILFWGLFFTLVQFDMLLVFCVLLGVSGLLRADQGDRFGWLFLALGIGLGALIKGPVILIHLLPLALLAPLWVSAPPARGWPGWYAGVFASLCIGTLIALAWAVPAARSGGEAYAQAIFWGQSADRLVNSFAHREPVWWYVAWLPVLALPWILWSPVWRGFLDRALWRDRGVRLVLLWVLPVFIVLSLVSGKQAKYLMPLLPAFALLVSRSLTLRQESRVRAWPALVVLAGSALIFAALPLLEFRALPYWAKHLPPAWGVLPACLGLLLALYKPRDAGQGVRAIVLGSVFFAAFLHVSLVRVATPAYDIHPVSEWIGRHQAKGAPIAHVGKYHGQFHFLGRLLQPVEPIDYADARAWAAARREGYLVFYTGHTDVPVAGSAYHQPWRSRQPGLVIWKADDFLMLE